MSICLAHTLTSHVLWSTRDKVLFTASKLLKNLKSSIQRDVIAGVNAVSKTANSKQTQAVVNSAVRALQQNPTLVRALAQRAGIADITDALAVTRKASSTKQSLPSPSGPVKNFTGGNVPLLSSPLSSLSRGSMRLSESDTTTFVTSDGSGFQLFTYQVNPRNASLFPKASQIAGHFNRWKLHRARLVFQPTVGTGMAVSSSLGTACIAYTDDPNDAAPATMLETANLPNKVISVVYNQCQMDVKGNPSLLFTGGSDSQTAVSDLRFSSCGILYFAVDYSPAAFPLGSKLGMLVCDYDIELSQFLLQSTAPSSVAVPPLAKIAFNPAVSTRGYINVPYNVYDNTTKLERFSLVLPPGSYNTDWLVTSSAAATPVMSITYDGDIINMVPAIDGTDRFSDYILDRIGATNGYRASQTFVLYESSTVNFSLSTTDTFTVGAVIVYQLTPGYPSSYLNASDAAVMPPLNPSG